MYSVEADNLIKRYGSNEALRGVSFRVSEGEIFGIIGPDGAGKTSIFRILTTLILPDGGSARVLGLDVVQDYHGTGYAAAWATCPAAFPSTRT